MVEALLFSAVLLGLAGTPPLPGDVRCGVSAVAGGRRLRQLLPLHLGRLLTYSAAGAGAAVSVGSLAAMGQAVTALRPLWTLVHMAALALFLIWQCRQPAWMEGLGRSRSAGTTIALPSRALAAPARFFGLGLAWLSPAAAVRWAAAAMALALAWALGHGRWLRFAARCFS